MNVIGNLFQLATWAFVHMIDWALNNWAVTMLFLATLIYWAGRQRRLNRHQL